MILQDVIDNSKKLEIKYFTEKQKRNDIENDIVDLNNKIISLEDENSCLNIISSVHTKASYIARDNARKHFEKIVTDALQFVTQSKDYEFIIQDTSYKSKTGFEFFVKSTVNGIECIQKPKDANGGGFVDIISVAAKYAYLEVFNDPKIMNNTLFYDEPGKMISEQMSVKFAEYIKFLGNQYGRQTIMITHNENLSNVADKTFVVKKDNNGISHTTIQTSLNVDLHINELEEIYNEIKI